MDKLPYNVRQTWWIELRQVAIVASLSLVLGWLIGYPVGLLAAGLGLHLLWYMYRVARLVELLRTKDTERAPPDDALWHPIFADVRRLQTRSRKRKRRLSRFLQRFREAATAFPDAAVILGRNEQVQWCNPGAYELLGIAWPTDAGRPLTALLRDPLLADYLAAGEFHGPLVITSPAGGGRRVCAIQITPFGRKHERLLIARDITPLHGLQQVRRDFVANASHELRTPLTIISGFLEEIAADVEETELSGPVSLMREQAARMTAIVEELLTLSRLEMEADNGEPVPVLVNELLVSIVADMRPLIDTSGHTIEVACNPALRILGHAQMLRSALSNLLMNAVRHTPPRTPVSVTCEQDSQGARIDISDHGPGIAPRHLPRLTERFYRVDEGRSAATGGTGLGLAIVKHALERHDANLHITSEMGAGSVFRCRFPAHRVVSACEESTEVIESPVPQRDSRNAPN